MNNSNHFPNLDALRYPIESRLARTLVEKALATGYTISVYDGEAYPVKRSTDRHEILSALSSTDSDWLVFRKPDGEKVGSVLLIWGNGRDLFSDWSDKPEIGALVDEVMVACSVKE